MSTLKYALFPVNLKYFKLSYMVIPVLYANAFDRNCSPKQK